MDTNITPRTPAIAEAMARAGEMYDQNERRVVADRRQAAAAPVDPNEDLLEVARTLCASAARRAEMALEKRRFYPHVDEEGSPALDAARAACIKRGYNQDGTEVPGRVYPHNPVVQLPPGVNFDGFADEDECTGKTILDYARDRLESEPDAFPLGATFNVLAVWTQPQEWRVVAPGNPLELERISPPCS